MAWFFEGPLLKVWGQRGAASRVPTTPKKPLQGSYLATAFLFLLGGLDQVRRASQWAVGLVGFDSETDFCFAEQTVFLRNLLKRS